MNLLKSYLGQSYKKGLQDFCNHCLKELFYPRQKKTKSLCELRVKLPWLDFN